MPGIHGGDGVVLAPVTQNIPDLLLRCTYPNELSKILRSLSPPSLSVAALPTVDYSRAPAISWDKKMALSSVARLEDATVLLTPFRRSPRLPKVPSDDSDQLGKGGGAGEKMTGDPARRAFPTTEY